MDGDETHSPHTQPVVCLLGAGFDTNNLGVNALTDGALHALFSRFPDASAVLVNYGRSPRNWTTRVNGQTYHVPLIPIRFSWRIYLPNNIALLILLEALGRLPFVKHLFSRLRRKNAVCAALSRCSVAAAVSGGDSFSDLYGLRRFFYVTLPQLLVLAAGRPLVLLPQTIGPFHGWISRLIARRVLHHARLIYSRDREGIDRTLSLTGGQRQARHVRFCHDMAFGVPGSDRRGRILAPADPSPEGTIGINVSGLLWMGGYRRNNMFGLAENYPRMMHRIAADLAERIGNPLLLVPHVFGESNPESDEKACRVLLADLQPFLGNQIRLAPLPYNQRTVKEAIGSCSLFIGSRMHACIAALSMGVPITAVAYSDKFAGILRPLGLNSLIADARRLSVAEIVSVIETAHRRREELRNKIREQLPRIHGRLFSLFEEIDRTVSRRS